MRLEQFESLESIPGLRHGFVIRAEALDIKCDKAEALDLLEGHYRAAVEQLGFAWSRLQTAEQVHGAEIAVVEEPLGGLELLPGVDALLSKVQGVALGIMVADCCAVYLVDPIHRAVSLVHSGKKGTVLGIVANTVAAMSRYFGSSAADLIAQLSPCIRPPLYEEDFAAEIRRQLVKCGLRQDRIHDERKCTGSNLNRYYSYRIEQGKTGRMLALLGFL